MCGTITVQEQPFSELILYFNDKHHHTNSKKSNACPLGELLRSNTSGDNNIDDFDCFISNRKTKATIRNRVHRYPRVLCIAISCGSYNENQTDLVQTSVEFPIDTFKPKKYSLSQDFLNDADDITYNLVATMYCYPNNRNDGGHFTAICKQHRSGMWYSYDDQDVKTSTFSKSVKGVPKAKKEFQQAAELLFYIQKESTQVDASLVTGVDGNDHGSTYSTHNSRTSRFSAFGSANITTQINTHNNNDKEDDCHIEGNVTTVLDQDKVR